jgi:hypothetical protein
MRRFRRIAFLAGVLMLAAQTGCARRLPVTNAQAKSVLGKSEREVRQTLGRPLDIGYTDYCAPSPQWSRAAQIHFWETTTAVIYGYRNLDVHFNVYRRVFKVAPPHGLQ